MITLHRIALTCMFLGLIGVGVALYVQSRLQSVISGLRQCQLESDRLGLGPHDPIPDTPTCNAAVKAERALPGWIVNVPPWRSR